MINTTLVKFNDILLFLPPHSVPYKILVNFWYNRWEFTKTEHQMEISSLSTPTLLEISSLSVPMDISQADGNVQRHCSQSRWKFPASLHTKPMEPMEISSVTAQARWKFPASLPQAPARGILQHHILQMNKKAKIILLFIFAMWASGNLVLETTGSWISSWKPGLERFEDRWAFFKSNASRITGTTDSTATTPRHELKFGNSRSARPMSRFRNEIKQQRNVALHYVVCKVHWVCLRATKQ